MIEQSVFPGRSQDVRHVDTSQDESCSSAEHRVALTAEEFVGVVTSLREAGDLCQPVRRSLTIDEINRRGHDDKGHASNDELGDLHLGLWITYEGGKCARKKMGFVGRDTDGVIMLDMAVL